MLFGMISDPALSTDVSGVFHPSKQAHAVLSVEQLFRRVASIQTSYRDTNACRVLLFTVLDTLERLTGQTIENFGSARFARGRLEKLKAEVPREAGEILLPATGRAVAALEQVSDGFFLCRRFGTDTVEAPQANGTTKQMRLDEAAAAYLKVLRNATHGHGSNKEATAPTTNALLAQHNGHLPHDLALLGYLYLLDLLVDPDRLARRLYRQGKV